MSQLVVAMLFLSVVQVFAQGEGRHKLSFDFGYGINSYVMDRINEEFASQPNVGLLNDGIHMGQQFRISCRYRPFELFDIGLYGSYQYGSSSGEPTISETDQFGQLVEEHQGSFELATKALGIGITNTWYLSHVLKFHEKESGFLKRFHLGIEVNGGIGFSRATADLQFRTLSMYTYDYFQSMDFQGQAGLRVEYDLLKQPIIPSIGIQMGYQYFRTATVQDRLGRDWVVDGGHSINLDFSGFYAGMYLKIGK